MSGAAAVRTRSDRLLYLLSRVLNRLFGERLRLVKYYFVAQPVVAAPAPVPQRPRAGRFHIDWAPPDHPAFAHCGRPAAVIAARFAQGARCLLATAEHGQLAGFLWYIADGYDEDEVRARFVPAPHGAAIWDFDVTIFPQYRMSRLFAQLWAKATADLASRGVRHTLSRISAFNPMSIASHQRLGATVLGSALFVCVGGWELMLSTRQPRVHLSWRADQRPVLRVEA